MFVVDSHTEGEPTRVVVTGGPDLGGGSVATKAQAFASAFTDIRQQIVCEPRGHEAMVGALLCEASEPGCVAGVIFFNTEGVLGMCGHGLMGLAVTLHHLGRIGLGISRYETPVGVVSAELIGANLVAVENVPSRRHITAVTVTLPDGRQITGDVAWGGNWFFLCDDALCPVDGRNIAALTRHAQLIADALKAQGITGTDGAVIDHIEIFGAPSPGADSRSFVLCPSGAFDRSPCGTGTSAKLACLAADGMLPPDTDWVQDSVTGGRFTARYRHGLDGAILPRLTGRAFVVSESRLIADVRDPYRFGFRTA